MSIYEQILGKTLGEGFKSRTVYGSETVQHSLFAATWTLLEPLVVVVFVVVFCFLF